MSGFTIVKETEAQGNGSPPKVIDFAKVSNSKDSNAKTEPPVTPVREEIEIADSATPGAKMSTNTTFHTASPWKDLLERIPTQLHLGKNTYQAIEESLR